MIFFSFRVVKKIWLMHSNIFQVSPLKGNQDSLFHNLTKNQTIFRIAKASLQGISREVDQIISKEAEMK